MSDLITNLVVKPLGIQVDPVFREVQFDVFYEKFVAWAQTKLFTEGFDLVYEWQRFHAMIYNEIVYILKESVIYREFIRIWEDIKMEIKFMKTK